MAKVVRIDDKDYQLLKQIRFAEKQDFLKDTVHLLLERYQNETTERAAGHE